MTGSQTEGLACEPELTLKDNTVDAESVGDAMLVEEEVVNQVVDVPSQGQHDVEFALSVYTSDFNTIIPFVRLI